MRKTLRSWYIGVIVAIPCLGGPNEGIRSFTAVICRHLIRLDDLSRDLIPIGGYFTPLFTAALSYEAC